MNNYLYNIFESNIKVTPLYYFMTIHSFNVDTIENKIFPTFTYCHFNEDIYLMKSSFLLNQPYSSRRLLS